MKENVDKHIEKLTDRLFKEVPLETPSLDFTANVMSQVEAITQSDVTIYKPLISKKAWIAVIAVAITGILAYMYFGTSSQSVALTSVDLSVLTNNKLANALSGFSFSKTIIYATAMFALMFMVQVTLLKGYFDKRLSL